MQGLADYQPLKVYSMKRQELKSERMRTLWHQVFSTSLLCLALILSTLSFSATPKHDYHVSVTQIQYNPGTKVLEVSIRIFTDDLEKGLSADNQNKPFAIKNNDQNNPVVAAYLRKHFILTDTHKKTIPLRYVGKEQEEDATWVYLEIPLSNAPAGHSLQNSILTEIFDDQVNMTNITLGLNKKTHLFKKGQLPYML